MKTVVASLSRFSKIASMAAVVAAVAASPVAARGQGPDIVDRLERSGQFSILLAALDAANLDDALRSEGPFTLFAPTDRAFAALLDELDLTAEQLLASPDLPNILLYHVAGGSLRTLQLLRQSTHPTLFDDQPVLVVLERGRLKVNRSTVTRANVPAVNGVIHYIDSVLLPPSEPITIDSIVDVLKLDGRFTVLLAALEAAGLDDALAGSDELTLFAPTDEAFGRLLADLGVTAEQLLDDARLADILLYHVVAGDRSAIELLLRRQVPTLQGDSVSVTLRRAGIFVDDARVIVPNVDAPNGKLHMIDGVLLP